MRGTLMGYRVGQRHCAQADSLGRVVLVAQFAEWMSANTKSNIQISRVSCLDPAAAGALATCQFTATLDPHGPTTTYFHDFKCTAELDLAGSVTNVERPDSIAWILSEHITQ